MKKAFPILAIMMMTMISACGSEENTENAATSISSEVKTSQPKSSSTSESSINDDELPLMASHGPYSFKAERSLTGSQHGILVYPKKASNPMPDFATETPAKVSRILASDLNKNSNPEFWIIATTGGSIDPVLVQAWEIQRLEWIPINTDILNDGSPDIFYRISKETLYRKTRGAAEETAFSLDRDLNISLKE